MQSYKSVQASQVHSTYKSFPYVQMQRVKFIYAQQMVTYILEAHMMVIVVKSYNPITLWKLSVDTCGGGNRCTCLQRRSIIQSLKIVSRAPQFLLGRPPTTLEQYFSARCQENCHPSDPKQLLKDTSEISMLAPDTQTQRLNPVREERKQVENELQTQRPKTQPGIQTQTTTEFPNRRKEQTHTFYIKDLYERMPGWKILCRVNYLREFISSKGTKCKMMYLIDQKGDYIKCMYYSPKISVELHQTYSFSHGEINQVTVPQTGQKFTQLVLGSGSRITQQENIAVKPFLETKLNSFLQLTLLVEEEVNLIGIVKRVKCQEIKTKTKKKVKLRAMLMDPLTMSQVEFNKFLLEGQRVPEEGQCFLLIGFLVVSSDNAVKLRSGHRSYFTNIQRKDLTLYQNNSQLTQLLHYLDSPKNLTVKNYSQTIFTPRTISEIISMHSQTDSSLYTSLSCSIDQLEIKKQYMACPHCKKKTSEEAKGLWKCWKCLKIVDGIVTFSLNVGLADGTGKIQLTCYGETAVGFLGIGAEEFYEMSPQQQQIQLQISKFFPSYQIHLKSEKKTTNQLQFSILQVNQEHHQSSLKQIRRRTVEKKLKYHDKWADESIKIQHNG